MKHWKVSDTKSQNIVIWIISIVVIFYSSTGYAQENGFNVTRIRRAAKGSAWFGGSSHTLCEPTGAPKGGGLSCTASSRKMTCTATCLVGFAFPDGSHIKKHVCNNYDGTWLPDMRFPDCDPVCDPPCANGGRCYGDNKCVCTPDFRGNKCEHPISNCDGNQLKVMGSWSCNHTSVETTCVIACAPGMQFEYPPASVYICDLQGNWLPKYVPKCNPMQGNAYLDRGTFGAPMPTSESLVIRPIETKVLSAPNKWGSCSSWGQMHYRTFDGSMFSVQGHCTYLLVRDILANTFSIQVKNDPHCNGVRDCQRSVIIYTGDNKYTLENSLNGPAVYWGEHLVRVPTTINGLLVEKVADYILVKSSLGFAVKWNGKDVIGVDVSHELYNNTAGLCGCYDGKQSTDLAQMDGTVTTNTASLVNSWKMNGLDDVCQDASKLEHTCKYDSTENQMLSEMADEKCGRIMHKDYASCHEVLDPKPYFEMCRLDYCACGLFSIDTCMCSSVSAYFHECHRLGGKMDGGWRKPDFCSIECPSNMVYQDCGSSCPKTCQKNVEDCSSELCVDGCQCQPGTVFHEDRCVKQEECPCFHSGKPFANGQSIQQDCNTCVCDKGRWQCTNSKCQARCSSVGDPHYTTFDGKHYNFMGKCSYYLMHDRDFSIEQENVACSGAISENMGYIISQSLEFPSCTKSVTIRYRDNIVQLKQKRQIFINHKEVNELPASVKGIHVYTASSLYVKAELDNGLTVMWDGLSRVYVDAPISFASDSGTRGLCGTFNYNQKDDFLTAEGDVEQDLVAFANKWKTSDTCQDLTEESEKRLGDPCQMFPTRRDQARQVCGKIKSHVFAGCHEIIDPESFYKDCMYDVCYCQTKLENCLCPAIADYALECTKMSVPVDWRTHVGECGINCPSGQTYQVCGNPCQRSCTDISYHSSCRASDCLEGCNCPPGMTLSGQGECVPLSECPCVYGGKTFSAGRLRMRGNETCECANAVWECRHSSEAEVLTAQLVANDEKVACSAAANMEYTDCASDCPATCRNMHAPPKCDSATCKPGCACKKGYVLDTKSSHCVKPTVCPCHHGGQSYGEGEMIQEECNTCVCEGGMWKCEQRECPGTCSVWGESHFRSFDGRVFEFHGDCDYLLTRGASDIDGKFLVTIHNVPCGTSDVTCSRAVSIQIGDEKVTLSSDKPIPKITYGSRYLIRRVGLFVFVHTDIGITVQWDKGTRIYVRADVKWKDKLDGICGNFNDNENDDFRTSEGGPPVAKATVFGDSWRLHSHCPVSKLVNNTCDLHPHRKSWASQKCSVLKSSLFRSCHTEVPFEPYLDRCILDTCGCDMGGDCECLCTALAAYAQECNAHGVPILWRSQDLCPIQCETCAKYTACMSVCPPLTCATQYVYAGVEETCGREACVEGCEPRACEGDQLFDGDEHFRCIPKAQCVEQPCRLINGRMYQEGERIRDETVADVCQSCYCRQGDIVCKGKKCIEDSRYVPTTAKPAIEETTTVATVDAASCEKDGWTEWMNGFNPTFKNGGDYETLELLKKRRFSFCPLENMRHIECRTAATHKHYKETGQNVWCSLPEGLLCENKDQPSLKLCYDYEVRVFCKCSPEETTVITRPPDTTVVTTTTTEEPIPEIKCNAPGWTHWMNSMSPTSEEGEREVIPELRRRHSFCADNEIERAECRPVNGTSGGHYSAAGSDDVECTGDRGLVCRNHPGKMCPDYEVRFYCQCTETDCDYPRGLESGAISDQHISVSSFRTPATLGHKARLRGNAAWSAGSLNDHEWLEVDLGETQEVSGIVTQGNPNKDEWVSSFKLMYNNDGHRWYSVQTADNQDKVFIANTDRNSVVTNMIEHPIFTRYIRLIPVGWEKWISLRMEILGCNRIVTTTPATTMPPSTTLTTELPTTTTTTTTTTYQTTTTTVETTIAAITRGTPFPYQCVKNAWTDWMNIDTPNVMHNYEIRSKTSGDVEPLEELRYFYSFCAHPTTVECRATRTKQMSHLSGQKVRCDLDGFLCQNDAQDEGECLDYELRFYCQCQEETTEAPPPTTTGFARTTVPEAPPVLECANSEEEHGWTRWMNSNDPSRQRDGDMETYSDLRAKFSFCADRFITDIECRVAGGHLPFSEAGQYGVVCDANRGLQCLHSMQPNSGRCKDYEVRFYCMCQTVVTHIVIPTAATNFSSLDSLYAHTVTPSFVTNGPIDVICNAWTSWMNNDSPLDDGADRELLWTIPRFTEFCPKQAAHQCRDAATKENFLHTGQNLKERCNANGIVCESQGQKCRDYEIRVFCLCPTPPPEVISPPCTHGWTSWIDTDDPHVGEGDFEQIEDIRVRMELCPSELITDVECQARSYSVGLKQPGGRNTGFGKTNSKVGTKTFGSAKGGGDGVKGSPGGGFSNWLDYTETGDIGVKCSKYSGLACYNNLQPKKKKCRDYRIRLFCNCGVTRPTQRTTKTILEEPIATKPTTPFKNTSGQTEMCGWSAWLNADRPDDTRTGDGDFETIERLQEEYGVCSKEDIRKVECRLSDSSKTPFDFAGQTGALCDVEHGLRCENAQQAYGCYDYEIRILCLPQYCLGTTTPHPTEQATTVIATPPCSPGLTWTECAYRCDSLCQSFSHLSAQSKLCIQGGNSTCIPGCISEECVPPKVWRDENTCVHTDECTCITDHGQLLPPGDVLELNECEKCQCIANSLHCEVTLGCSTDTTLSSNQFTETPVPKTGNGTDNHILVPVAPIPSEQEDCWTLWMNVDQPQATPGDPGDVEDLAAIIPHYSFCPSPVQVECRVASTKQSAAEAGQKIVCDPKIGLLCWNEVNIATSGCYDYEVRFYCPCAASTTISTTVHDIDSDGILPHAGECQAGFTNWISANKPTAVGESENLQDARRSGYSVCESGRITALECRTRDSGVAYDRSSDRGVLCDLMAGLMCRGSDQPYGQQCSDYEVRYFCNCEEETSPAATTTTETTVATTAETTVLTTVPPTTVLTTAATVMTTGAACSYWSDWINQGKPWLGFGDVEILQQPTDFCKEGTIQDIECVEEGTNIRYQDTNSRGVVCSVGSGFKCSNKKQPGKMCKDFKIRYFCGCEVVPTTTETTTLPTTTTTESITTTTSGGTTIIIVPPPIPPSIVCNPLDYIYVVRNDEKELPDSQLKASSSLNALSGPQASRLDSQISPYSDGGWIPLVKDGEQYIQADLAKPEVLYGIATQGHAVLQTWVTSFRVLYSVDGVSFSYVTSAKDNSPKTFTANYDHVNIAVNTFDEPIEARYIRVVPKTWHTDIALRFDLIGCLEHATTVPYGEHTTQAAKCDEPMGLENGKLSPRQISASTSFDEHQGPNKARLNKNFSWAPKISDRYQFLQFDFMGPRIIEGVSTQGHFSAPQWVTSYSVSYSTDGLIWTDLVDRHNIKRIFVANYDEINVVTNYFEKPIRTQYMRIIPQSYHNWIAMRTEIIGCYEPYPSPPEINQPTDIPSLDCREHMNANLTRDKIVVSSSLAGDRSGAPRLALDTEEQQDTGGWVAGTSDRKQYVLIDYGRDVELTGIITQGRNKHNEWVTAYAIQFSTNKEDWKTVKDERENPIFTGNSDSNTPVDHYFNSAVQARYLKIVPKKWHNWIAMRLEVLGCPPHIELTTGFPVWTTVALETRMPYTTPIPTTTTTFNDECYTFGPWFSRHTPNPEVPGDHEPMAELIATTRMCDSPALIECREVVTGRPHHATGQRVSCDLTRGLVCNDDEQEPGVTCYNYEARIACYHCGTTVIATTPLPVVVLCPEVPEMAAASCPSYCGVGQLCDGTSCVNPVDCPCVQDGKHFKPGTLIQTTKCEECTCKLKGHSYCKNITCPLCPYGQTGTPDNHCQCACKTCPSGQLLCPTNLACLEERLWCDGVADCPDDEKDCPTTTQRTTSTTPSPPPCPVQPIPECSPGTMLVLSNAAEACPSYACVAVPTPAPTPPPVEKSFCEMSNNYFKTFDGFGFQYEICQHIILQDKIEQRFNITVHKNCSEWHGGCQRYLQVAQNDHLLVVDTELRVNLNGMVYSDSQLVRLARTSGELTARIIGDTVIVKSVKYGYEISWNTEGNARFAVTSDLVFHVNGLCGYFSNSAVDDMQSPDGQQAPTVVAFGDSWSVDSADMCTPSTCPPDVAAKAIAACDELRLTPFDSCNGVIDPAHHIQVCVASICECLTQTNTSEKDCRCKAYLPYVEACEMKSIAKIRYWRVKQSCLPNCPPGLVWQDCGSACERTCDSLQEFHGDNEPTCDSEHCIAGCFCPVGLVRKGDHCVQPEKCQDCVCKGYGDPHYFTYDGLYYAFQGNCTYVLSQDKATNGVSHKFQVFATNEDCHEEPMTTCTVAIMLIFNDHMAHFRINESVTFDGIQLYQSDYPFHAYGIHIESIPGRSVSFSVPEIFLEVRYFELNYGFEVRIPSEVYYNKTEGLCGNCNFEKGDDLCTKDGGLTNDTNDFGFSWLAAPPEGFESINEICKLKEASLGSKCDEAALEQQELCDRLKGDDFLPCHALVDPDPYLRACRYDVCHSTNAQASLCRSITEYARKCAEFGICIQNWRTKQFCHYECPDGMYFDQCGPKCPKSCKDVTPSGWELSPRNSIHGKDIVDQEPFSLRQVLQELEDVCDSTPVDGCFCQGGRVLKDNVCVDPIMCELCDAENHKVGESWMPNPCIACHCSFQLTVECTKTECPTKPTCTTDESLRVISHADNHTCCTKWECLQKSSQLVCPQADVPSCEPGEVMKIQHNTTDGCPRFFCECDINECPPVRVPTNLDIGEITLPIHSGCCPSIEIACLENGCPVAPVCSEAHVLKVREDRPHKCCQEYLCEPLPNICLYAHEYEVLDGQQVKLQPGSFIEKSYQAGDKWNDGLCKKCFCESGLGQYRHRCTLELCPTLGDYQDSKDYTWRVEKQPNVCCPKFIREMCVANGRNYSMDEEWDSPDEEKCKKFRCGKLGSGETIKIERTMTCMKECSLGSKYIDPPSTSSECCGRCEPDACVEEGKLYEVGDTWNSTSQKCYKAECLRVNEQIQTRFVGKACKQLPVNCSRRIWDESGCCELCNETTATQNQHVCQPIKMSPKSTIGMFELFQGRSRCTNKEPIVDMMECIGLCESSSTYSSGYGDFVSVCHCCTPQETVKMTVLLDCTDGKKRPVDYNQPKQCSCTTCNGGANYNQLPVANPSASMRLVKPVY